MKIITLVILQSLLLLEESEINKPITPMDENKAGVIYWHDGTLIFAHNYLAGTLLYELSVGDIITAKFENDTTKRYILTRKKITTKNKWIPDLEELSNKDSLTFVTCYPEFPSPQLGYYLFQFEPFIVNRYDQE